jgi:hypothetical protein
MFWGNVLYFPMSFVVDVCQYLFEDFLGYFKKNWGKNFKSSGHTDISWENPLQHEQHWQPAQNKAGV